jgi:hypothetical protein
MEDRILKAVYDNEEWIDLDDYKDRENLIQDKLDKKDGDEVISLFNRTIRELIDTPVSERGGLVAITGFYYQMLAVIDYFIQMRQGKWDYVAVELHDDIVAVKGNHIRFIQVKTSNSLTCQVSNSPVSSIYSRGNKEINVSGTNSKVNCKISNSWIDKLILKAKHFKKEDGFFTEFELLTNYVITNSADININKYIEKNNSKVISARDNIYKILKGDSYINDPDKGKYIKVVYEDICGEKLEELLSRFYIESKQTTLNNIDQYVNSICQKIGTEIGGAYISYDDINWLIGKLFARCNVNADNRSLVVTKDEVESIFLEIESRAMQVVTKLAEDNGTKNLVESVYESMHNEYKEFKHYSVIEMKILEYKQYLIDWINRNGGINKIINRYISANEISNKHIGMSKREKENIIEELITMPIILILIHNKKISYTNNNTLLTKELYDSEGVRVSLLRLGRGRFRQRIEDIKLILNNLGTEDVLKLSMSKNLNIILQGYSDRSFSNVEKLEIKLFDECSELIEQDTSIRKVHQVVSLIPGLTVKECLEIQLEEDKWDESELKLLWENMMRSE